MPILTLAELQASVIQADVAKEAYAQVEKRLSDLLETKKSFETRAASLLTGFTTLALAVAGAGSTFFTSQSLADAAKGLPWAFFVAAIPLLLAAWSMLIALYPTSYGNLGTSPEVWLVRNVIDAPNNVVAPMQAYMIFHMNNRIVDTERANNTKAKRIMEGALLATLSPLVLAGGILLAWRYG